MIQPILSLALSVLSLRIRPKNIMLCLFNHDQPKNCEKPVRFLKNKFAVILLPPHPTPSLEIEGAKEQIYSWWMVKCPWFSNKFVYKRIDQGQFWTICKIGPGSKILI